MPSCGSLTVINCDEDVTVINCDEDVTVINCDEDVTVIETATVNLTINNSGGGAYYHNQPTPSLTWIINHNQGALLNASAYNTGSQAVVAEVVQISPNQLQILFNTPTAGFAILS